MKLLRTACLILLSVIFFSVAQHALADTFPSWVRVTQENSTSLFDGKFNDGTLAAIRFILSDHADSVLVRIKSGQTVLRTIKGTNFAMGDTSVIWNGKTDAGATVKDGSYSIQIRTSASAGCSTERYPSQDNNCAIESESTVFFAQPSETR